MQNTWQKKLTGEEYQRWGLNVYILEREYLNVGSDLQNIKLEQNTQIKGCRSIFTNSGKCNEVLKELRNPGRQKEH